VECPSCHVIGNHVCNYYTLTCSFCGSKWDTSEIKTEEPSAEDLGLWNEEGEGKAIDGCSVHLNKTRCKHWYPTWVALSDGEAYLPPPNLLAVLEGKDPEWEKYLAIHDPDAPKGLTAEMIGMMFLMGKNVDAYVENSELPALLSGEDETKSCERLRSHVSNNPYDAITIAMIEFAGYSCLADLGPENVAAFSPKDGDVDRGDRLRSELGHQLALLSQESSYFELVDKVEEDGEGWVHPVRRGWYLVGKFEELDPSLYDPTA